MKNNLRKMGQASPQTAPQNDESSFTEADFATAIHKFLKGMDEFVKIGMVDTGVPPLLSGAVDLVNRFLTASPASNYLEREIGIGARSLNKDQFGSKDIIENTKRSFSQRVSNKINNAFEYFNPIIEYSKELLQNANIAPDSSRVNEYEKIKHIIERINTNKLGNLTELNSKLSFLISEVKNNVNLIKQKSGTNFSLLNQFLNLDSASNTGIDIDQDTLSDKKFDLNNIPANLKNQLSILLKELLTLQALVSVIKGVGLNLPTPRSVSVSGSRMQPASSTSSTSNISSNTSPQPTGSPGSTMIVGIASTDFVPDGTNSYKLSNISTSSNPSIILKVRHQKQGSLQAYDLFSILYRSRLIQIENGSGLSNPPQDLLDQLQKISEIITNPNSNNLFLNLSWDSSNNVYNLNISILNSVAKKIARYPGIGIFKLNMNNKNYIIKSGKNLFLYNSGISDIFFDTNDLISNSSNISEVDRQKILNKLKQ